MSQGVTESDNTCENDESFSAAAIAESRFGELRSLIVGSIRFPLRKRNFILKF